MAPVLRVVITLTRWAIVYREPEKGKGGGRKGRFTIRELWGQNAWLMAG
jgi:hypothetical protein